MDGLIYAKIDRQIDGKIDSWTDTYIHTYIHTYNNKRMNVHDSYVYFIYNIALAIKFYFVSTIIKILLIILLNEPVIFIQDNLNDSREKLLTEKKYL